MFLVATPPIDGNPATHGNAAPLVFAMTLSKPIHGINRSVDNGKQ
jgi:hypothetical protein